MSRIELSDLEDKKLSDKLYIFATVEDNGFGKKAFSGAG